MAESISDPPQKLPISQLHTSSANSFFMFPSSTNEVAQLIENLNDKKTIRSNDVETRFINPAVVPWGQYDPRLIE